MSVQAESLLSRSEEVAEAVRAETNRLGRRIQWNGDEQRILQDPLDSFRAYIRKHTLGEPGERWPRVVVEGCTAWLAFVTGGPGAGAGVMATTLASKAAGGLAALDPVGGREWRDRNTALARRLMTQLKVQEQAIIITTVYVQEVIGHQSGAGNVEARSTSLAMLGEVLDETARLIGLSRRFLGIWTPLDAIRGDTDANAWLEERLRDL